MSRFRLLSGILVALALHAITPEVKAQGAGPPFDIDAIAAKTDHAKQDITLHLDLAHFGEIDIGETNISPETPLTLTRSTTNAEIIGAPSVEPAKKMSRDPPRYVDCGRTSIECVTPDANASERQRRR